MERAHEQLEAPQCFETQAVTVLSHLRAAVGDIVRVLPGGVRNAAELGRALDLETKLSWRLFRVLQAPDPLSAGPWVPGSANMKAFLKAASKAGVPSDRVAAVEAAAREFEQVVAVHGGDRNTFDTMVGALTGNEDTEQANLAQRRAAFRANRHIWGVQAQTQVKCVLMNAGSDPARLDAAVVDGYMDLCALRRGMPLVIASSRVTTDAFELLSVRRRAIDSDGTTEHGMALLSRFCTEPLPRLTVRESEGGFLYGELESTHVGNRAAVNCFTGWVAPDCVGRYAGPGNEKATTSCRVRVPCKTLVICVLMRAGIIHDAQPTVAVTSDHQAERPYPDLGCPLDAVLTRDERPVYMGRGASVLFTADAPQLSEVVQYVFDQLGWNGQEFDAYRCQIAYPIFPSTVRIAFDLPGSPGT